VRPLLLVLGVILLIGARQAWVWRCLSNRGTASPAVVEAVRRSKGGWHLLRLEESEAESYRSRRIQGLGHLVALVAFQAPTGA
jgi:hypothetical protein